MRIDAVLNKICLPLCFMIVLSACSPKAAKVRPEEPVKAISISSLEIGKSDDRSVLTIKATESLKGHYTVIKVSDPPKVIIEMPTVAVGKFEGAIDAVNGVIAKVVTSRLNGIGVRMEVVLTSLSEHEVKAEGNTLEIYFAKPAIADATEKKVEEKVTAEVAPEVKAEAAAPVEEKASAPSAVVEAKKEEKADAPTKVLKVIDVKIKKAGKFTSAEIITDGEPSSYNVFDLKSPDRVIVDIGNAREISAKKDIKAASPHITGARLGRSDGHVRVVFDYKGSVKPYEVVKGSDRISILFGKTPATVIAKVEKSAAKEEAPKGKEEAKVETAPEVKAEAPTAVIEEPKKEEKAEAPKKGLKVTAVEIKKAGKLTRAEIITDGEPSTYKVFELKSPNRVIVDVVNAGGLSAKNIIKAVSPHIKGARAGLHDGQVRVVFDFKGSAKPYEVIKGSDRISILFGKRPGTVAAKEEKAPAKEEAAKVEEKVEVEKKPERAATEPAPAVKEAAPTIAAKPEVKEEVKTESKPEPLKEVKAEVKAKAEEKAAVKEKAVAAPVVDAKTEQEPAKKPAEEGAKEEMAKIYSGQKVTLEFKDADIKNIFRIIAEVSGNNMIIDNAVSGKVTIRLVNVPWDQALDILLETNSLGMKKVGNVIRVLPAAQIKKEEEDKQATKKTIEKFEDMVTKLIPVSYAKASDITGKIKSVMTDRGTAQVDERTNTIILKDIQKSLDEAVKLVASLDSPTAQISIEARIVEASNNFTRNLGVNWGTGYSADAAHGNPTGYYFPNSYGIVAGGGGVAANVPTGAAGAVTGGGAVGINFGSINNTLNLDLRLNALELQKEGKVISSPKIVTLDNKEASIEQGISIPYQTTSASGTQTQFVDASLNLTVTPHVTADGRLSMKIKASKNSPDTSVTGAGGAPSISKNVASTEILVKDGETTVIGGIYTIDKSETVTGIPLLKDLPLIGWMFRSKAKVDNKSELLIFITPRIIRDRPV